MANSDSDDTQTEDSIIYCSNIYDTPSGKLILHVRVLVRSYTPVFNKYFIEMGISIILEKCHNILFSLS